MPPPESPTEAEAEGMSSPTPTLRHASQLPVPSAAQAFAEIAKQSPGSAPGPSSPPPMVRSSSAQQQQGLGMGRPGRNEMEIEIGPELQIPTQSATVPSSPSAQYRSNFSPGRASSIRSFTTATEDGEYYDARPRTAAPGMASMESTPRGAFGTGRGMPHTAFGSSFGSPNAPYNAQMGGSGSVPRPARMARYNTSATQTLHNPGSMSRSNSRARPPLPISTARGGKDDEDMDELRDRGAELIKERQKERKARRRKLELERRMGQEGGDGVTPDTSAPPSGIPDESFTIQQRRGQASRSVSRTRAPSSDRRRNISDMGYFNRTSSIAGSETPREGGRSPLEELRPASIYSSTADDDEDDLAAQDQVSMLGEIVQDVVEEETAASVHDSDVGDEDGDDEGVTLRDRQDAINLEHPFGLPIWKPALYRKSRSITRNAENALHAIPSAAAERHLLPGNILWVILFGWWLTIACFVVAVLVSGAEVLGGGRGGYGKTLRGLAWYIGWPFGKYVEGEGAPEDNGDSLNDGDLEHANGVEYGTWANRSGSPVSGGRKRDASDSASSSATIRHQQSNTDPVTPSRPTNDRHPTVSFAAGVKGKARAHEQTPLLGQPGFRRPRNQRAKVLGRLVYWPVFFCVVAPMMLFVCVVCWGFVITIPMAKLSWALLTLLWYRPLEINFRAAPKIAVLTPQGSPASGDDSGSTTLGGGDASPSGFTMKRAHLTAGQVAPTSGPKSTVLLCTYRAVGLQYYKYTVGGVNIMFINLLPLVFFTIIDGLLILPAVEKKEHLGHAISPFLKLITAQALIFVLALASVIPLSYFIGMAVASISAQSSIGMGAVINATFGSIIEIILYAIALTQGKGRLVEGSIIGSILAGVLLMPGASMCSGAFKKKEMKFNAKSAGVTSTMLIMAIIGTLTPTMFYQTYGSFELHCEGCPEPRGNSTMVIIQAKDAWMCDHCYYEHPDPQNDPFYLEQVETMMYGCAAILLLSYLIGLWFSLRTHAAQIWQNPQQLMKPEDIAAAAGHPALKATLAQRLTPQAIAQHILPVHKSTTASPVQPSRGGSPKASTLRLPSQYPLPRVEDELPETARLSSNNYHLPAGYTPFLETVDSNIKNHSQLTPMRLPSALTTEDFTRAVAVATVSALRHQGSIIGSTSNPGSAQKIRSNVDGIPAGSGFVNGHGHGSAIHPGVSHEDEEEGGGHEAPSWTRGVSAGVLLGCTLLYAIIAEILVDVVDVVLQGSGIDEKFLGLTLFALVPNTTEFMNAMSFALNGNIALSMEIGSAYALQVCLLQIPAMIAFSALYKPDKMGNVVDTFTLIFPRWDVIAIILSIFLLTYTYIEARSNYHRGSILVLAYVVLIMGFYYAPNRSQGDVAEPERGMGMMIFDDGFDASFGMSITKLWG